MPARDEPLQVQEQGGCLVLTVNRPEVRNAINYETAVALDAAIRELDARPDLLVGVLTGSCGFFSAGKDMKAALAGERDAFVDGRGFAGFTRATRRKPVIAAVEGCALGGGFELALACDLIVAGRSAEFGLPEAGLGFVAVEGGLVRLPRRIPRNIACELALAGGRLGAARAAELGLVNRLVDNGSALSAALDLAGLIQRQAPLSVQASLQVLRDCDGLSIAAAFAHQDVVVTPVLDSRDSREGYASYAERRLPHWTGT